MQLPFSYTQLSHVSMVQKSRYSMSIRIVREDNRQWPMFLVRRYQSYLLVDSSKSLGIPRYNLLLPFLGQKDLSMRSGRGVRNFPQSAGIT